MVVEEAPSARVAVAQDLEDDSHLARWAQSSPSFDLSKRCGTPSPFEHPVHCSGEKVVCSPPDSLACP